MSKENFRKQFAFARIVIVIFVILAVGVTAIPAAAGQKFRIAIMQSQHGAAKKYRPLEVYLRTKGIEVQFVATPSYPSAAKMFADGKVDGMFSGSGVAGTLILKELADPVLRPVDTKGHSTYWAVLVAPVDAPQFTGSSDYFTQKKVVCCSLASSGEFFYRSIPDIMEVDSVMVSAVSHGAAVAGLSKGVGDVAIVKNWVWDSVKAKYPNLKMVGRDAGENPNGTLIVSKTATPDLVQAVTEAMMELSASKSQEATQVREQLGISKYVLTSRDDFKHTLDLLSRAGVDKDFNFQF